MDPGFTGPISLFEKCYNPSADEITDGVWTGSLTNVTAPDEWMMPERCTDEEYSPPSVNGTTAWVWVGQCKEDADCVPTLRSRVPTLSDKSGVDMCECYANTVDSPFDECEGESDMTCPIAGCAENACARLEAVCEVGVCELKETTANIVDDTTGDCATDEDCYKKMRSRVPTLADVVGVDMCGCYSDSSVHPFDECQGESDGSCPTARCAEDTCLGYEAFCSDEGKCDLAEADMIVPSYTWTGQCSSDDDCYNKIRERVPSLSDITGVGTCQCYANSLIDPLDECEGESDMTCPIAGCVINPCTDLEAYCGDKGVCDLRSPAVGNETIAVDDVEFISDTGVNNTTVIDSKPIEVTNKTAATNESVAIDDDPTDNETDANKTIGMCQTDDDCSLKVRSRKPSLSNFTGVDMCGCYAVSSKGPAFDECEGEDASCPIAKCQNTCEGLQAVCSTDEGICVISDPVEANPTDSAPSETDALNNDTPKAASGAFTKNAVPSSLTVAVVIGSLAML